MFFSPKGNGSKAGHGSTRNASQSWSLLATQVSQSNRTGAVVQLSAWMVQQVASHQTPEHRAQFLKDYFSKIAFFDKRMKEFTSLSSALKDQVSEFCEALTHREFLFKQIDQLRQSLPEVAKASEHVDGFLSALKNFIFQHSEAVRGVDRRLPVSLKVELNSMISNFCRAFTPSMTLEALKPFSTGLLRTIANFSGKLKEEEISQDYIFNFLEHGCDSKEDVRSKIEDLGDFDFALNFLDSESAPVQKFWRRFCEVQEGFQKYYNSVSPNINRYQGFLPLFHQLGDDVDVDFQDNFFRFCCWHDSCALESAPSFLVLPEEPPRPEEMIEFIFSCPLYVDAFIDSGLLSQGLRCAWKEWHRSMMNSEDKREDLFFEEQQHIFSEEDQGVAICLKWGAVTKEPLIKEILVCLEKIYRPGDLFLIRFIADLGGDVVDNFIKARTSARNKLPQEILNQLIVARDPQVEKFLPEKEYFLIGKFQFTGSGISDASERRALNDSDMADLALVLEGLAFK